MQQVLCKHGSPMSAVSGGVDPVLDIIDRLQTDNVDDASHNDPVYAEPIIRARQDDTSFDELVTARETPNESALSGGDALELDIIDRLQIGLWHFLPEVKQCLFSQNSEDLSDYDFQVRSFLGDSILIN